MPPALGVRAIHLHAAGRAAAGSDGQARSPRLARGAPDARLAPDRARARAAEAAAGRDLARAARRAAGRGDRRLLRVGRALAARGADAPARTRSLWNIA